MAKLLITTQIRENYGSIDNPHWKSKGSSDYVVKNFTEFNAIQAFIMSIRDQIETDNPFYQEHIVNYDVVTDDYLTRDERLQLQFDGKIMYPATEINAQQVDNKWSWLYNTQY